MTDPSRNRTPAPDDAPFRHTAPMVPSPAQPDSVFTADADTIARLAHRGALLTVRQPARVFVPAAIALALLPLGEIHGLWTQAVLTVAVVLGWPVIGYLASRRELRRLCALVYAPGALSAVQLGPDAMDIADADGYVRLPYEFIVAIREAGAFTLLQTVWTTLLVARELFPPSIVERLPALFENRQEPLPGSPAPLPPMPIVPSPHATVVADDDLGRHLLSAALREPWNRIPLVAAVSTFVVTVVALTAWLIGPRWAGLIIVMCVVLACVSFYAARNPAPDDVRALKYAAPGAVMATQFGSDGFVFQTATGLLRIRYADIRRIDIRDAVTIVRRTGRDSTYAIPTALFPEPVPAQLQRLGVRVVRH
ncbi:hypothetical protein ACWF82_27910 [Nocardia sp. NPDC055053]